MNNMTQLEKVLATELAKLASIDVAAIIEAAQAACIGGCKTVANENVKVVETPAEKVTKPVRTAKELVEANKAPIVEKPVQEKTVTTPPAEKKEEPAPEKPSTSAGVNLTGLFTGSGADKKVVKDVFLAAVEQAKTLQQLVALNATCDCGLATGDYTEETAAVLKRKLARWGAAQE